MTSTAQIEANRANARRSAGPRSAAGKARASRNARRHGLNTPIDADHAQLAIIEAWALRFCGGASAATRRARAAAIAQAELSRVRAAKATALRLAAEQVEAASADPSEPKETLAARALIASLPDLMKLDGYERKARSKRDKAFRRLIESAAGGNLAERTQFPVKRRGAPPSSPAATLPPEGEELGRAGAGADLAERTQFSVERRGTPPSSAEPVLGPAIGRTRGPTRPPRGTGLSHMDRHPGNGPRVRLRRPEDRLRVIRDRQEEAASLGWSRLSSPLSRASGRDDDFKCDLPASEGEELERAVAGANLAERTQTSVTGDPPAIGGRRGARRALPGFERVRALFFTVVLAVDETLIRHEPIDQLRRWRSLITRLGLWPGCGASSFDSDRAAVIVAWTVPRGRLPSPKRRRGWKMTLKASSIGAALIGAVLMSAAVVGSANAQATFNPLITVDENGHGVLLFPGESPVTTTGVLQADPGPGGQSSALTYNLLGPPSLVAGDLRIFEGGVFDDVVRFNPAGTGSAAYPASLVFYSNPVHGGFDSLADSASPPSAFYDNNLSLDEVGGRVFYHPSEGQPGFVAGFDVAYVLISDVPEPATWAMLILGLAMVGAAARRRRPVAAAAA